MGDPGPKTQPNGNEQFVEGYANEDPMPIHRAFDIWIDRSAGDDRPYQTPQAKLFALHNTRGKTIQSIADLDENDALRVRMVASIARQKRWHVFLGRLRSSWYGPKDRSPNRRMKDHTRDFPDQPPPPGFRTLSDPEFRTINQEETEQSLLQLHTIEGEYVLPREADDSESELVHISDRDFIQQDFLPFQPDTEEEKRPKERWRSGVWAKQTWYTNVCQSYSSTRALSFPLALAANCGLDYIPRLPRPHQLYFRLAVDQQRK